MQQPPEYPSSGQPPQQPYSQPYPPSQPYPHMPRPDGLPPGYPPYPPQRSPQKLSKFWRGVVIACGVIILACAACSVFGSMFNQSNITTKAVTTTAPTQQTTVAPTKAPPTPTPVPAIQYPPKTLNDLHGLAAQGNASAIHSFEQEKADLAGVCPQPKVLVTVDPA